MVAPSTAAYELPNGSMLIDGDWVTESDHGRRDHVNPATGKVQAHFVLAGKNEIDHAVGAARRALPSWRAMPAHVRRDHLLRLAALITEHDEELGVIAARESGRIFAPGTAFLAAQYFSYYAGWADKDRGITRAGRSLEYSLLEPRGVIAVIIPWNGPLSSIGMKVAAALAAGNTVVLKPPELAPFAALRFGELCERAGLPRGVVNVVPGGTDAGEALVRNPDVALITFTGGLPTARRVMEGAAANLTPVLLELGGKSASIVFADADLDRAGQLAAILALQVNAGQGCCLPTRLLVQGSVYAQVVERAVATAEALRPGDPLHAGTGMGPVISAEACERILAVIERSRRKKHGELLTGGGRVGGALADGFFLQPTIFSGVDNNSPLAQEEIFGPVLSISPFDDEAEAIRMANHSDFGLGAYVYTRDVARAHRVGAALDSGMVAINGMSPMLPTMPFGGVKNSGFGREGGREGLEEFLRPKHVSISLS
jgi:aldehyde dehydrogenase (NAD+)